MAHALKEHVIPVHHETVDDMLSCSCLFQVATVMSRRGLSLPAQLNLNRADQVCSRSERHFLLPRRDGATGLQSSGVKIFQDL
jgi:hypothetical protein